MLLGDAQRFALCRCERESQPAPDWAVEAAKTPTPANVGDASAVILLDDYLITVDDQNHAMERERSAVRILKPQGREYSHCEAEYDKDEKLDYFHSWTITADGRQLQAMDMDFMDVGAYAGADEQETERFRLLKPPGSDPGAVVTCEIETHLRPYMNSDDWLIQAPIPVVNEGLELGSAGRRRWRGHGRSTRPSSGPSRWRRILAAHGRVWRFPGPATSTMSGASARNSITSSTSCRPSCKPPASRLPMVNGIPQKPIEGVSMLYTFDKANANAASKRDTQYFEMAGNRAIYHDGWIAATTPPAAPWFLATGKLPDLRRLQLGTLRRQERLFGKRRPLGKNAGQAEGNARVVQNRSGRTMCSRSTIPRSRGC